ncbi:phosphodiester glycosidase family protein [Aquamicrobium segne]|uniref:Phosphodiester glycosidase family protein n=1 Tax=Aquamicrobium segne TaxID=469547 RepID=A0ABW0GWJ7_9HYPH
MAHIVCVFDPAAYDIRIAHADGNGRPFGSLAAFDEAMSVNKEMPLLSMNAGMYHKDLSPVGLLIEEGKIKAPLNLDDDKGNFFMKPNGVFLIGKEGQAAVMEAFEYARTMPDTLYATQSGPMLVIDGHIHPRFEWNGKSRYIRNGVGVDRNNQVVLVLSRKAVSLGHFARLFRDELKCDNALFLDGAVSAMSRGGKHIAGGQHPVGPILAVFEKEQ